MRCCSRTGRTFCCGFIKLSRTHKMLAIRTTLFCLVLSVGSTMAAAPPAGDQECLACNGQPGMKSGAGKSISIDPGKHAASAHGVLGCKDCHTDIKDFPHPSKVVKV